MFFDPRTLATLLVAMVADKPTAPAPKDVAYQRGKHRKGRQPAQNAEALRKNRQRMAKESRRQNRGKS